jgi:hypothetical protein
MDGQSPFRLHDRILRDFDFTGRGEFRKDIEVAQVIVADNVGKFFWQDNPKEVWNLAKDFPNLAPPFEVFWIEMRAPEKVVSETTGTQSWKEFLGIEEWGCLFHGWKREAGWAMAVACFFRKGEALRMPICFSFNLTSEGQIPEDPARPGLPQFWMHLPNAGKMSLEEATKHASSFRGFLDSCLLAISFMHCKNVELVDGPFEERFSKAQVRRGRPPLTRFKVLEIEPMKRVLRTEGQIGEKGVQHALHICRGHFKDYRQRGLFGKLKGMYWWDAFARGEADAGEVKKVYDVKAQ